jgi:hypothetical protein
MSALVLRGGHHHDIFDDIESLAYVFLFLCAQWMPHTEGSRLRQTMLLFNDSDPSRKSGLLIESFEDLMLTFKSEPIDSSWRLLANFTSEARISVRTNSDFRNNVLAEIRGVSRDGAATPLAGLLDGLKKLRDHGPWDETSHRTDASQLPLTYRGVRRGYCGSDA